jgi:hypothetical protein
MKRLVARAPDDAAFNRAHHSWQTSLIGDLSPAPGRSLPGPLRLGRQRIVRRRPLLRGSNNG